MKIDKDLKIGLIHGMVLLLIFLIAVFVFGYLVSVFEPKDGRYVMWIWQWLPH